MLGGGVVGHLKTRGLAWVQSLPGLLEALVPY